MQKIASLSRAQSTRTYQFIPPTRWSAFTALYDLTCDLAGLGKRFRGKVLRRTPLRDGMAVADIGCGTGVFLEVAKKLRPGVKFVGVDPDWQALLLARRRFRRARVEIPLKQGFAEDLPLADDSLDACFSSLAFHHMPDDIKLAAFREIHRVLRPDGTVVIADVGKTESRLVRALFLLEKQDYIRGNFLGVIPRYLERAGFLHTEIVGKHFPAIQIVRARK